MFQLIVNLDCVPNLETSLWKTTESALSMNLVALILANIISLLLAKWNKKYTATTNEMIKIESPRKISAAVF